MAEHNYFIDTSHKISFSALVSMGALQALKRGKRTGPRLRNAANNSVGIEAAATVQF
jgi:hypothetical protein